MGRPARAESDLGKPANFTPTQNNARAVWKLVPFHNPTPALLAWYPMVWTVYLASHISGKQIQAADFFTPLLKDLIIIVSIYTASRSLDAILHDDSGEGNPGSIARNLFLCMAYPMWALGTVAAVYYLQGADRLVAWLPTWTLSSLYAVVKPFSVLRRPVLGSAVVSVFLPAWVNSNGGGFEVREELILLGAFTFFWMIYIDILHTSMAPPSSFASTTYLSPSPLTHLSLTFLALLQLTTLSIYTYHTSKSPHFWILGVGGWMVNNVWHIQDLGSVEWLWDERAGDVMVWRNVALGAWLCGAEVCELWLGGVLVS